MLFRSRRSANLGQWLIFLSHLLYLKWWLSDDSLQHDPNSVGCSLLGGIFEITNKCGNIVLVFLTGLALWDVVHLGEEVLESRELMGSNLLENVRHHILDLLGLGVSCHNKKILSDGKLDYLTIVTYLVSYSEVS